METTLIIGFITPYKSIALMCFFADKETIEMIKKYRGDLPTHYIECKIEDFLYLSIS